MQTAIDAITDLIDSGDFNNEIVITPVIDLSEAQVSANELNSMFNQNYGITASLNRANEVSGMMDRRRDSKYDTTAMDDVNKTLGDFKNAVSDFANRPQTTFRNEFNITGSNPREIANEVSAILQKQIERKDAEWK
jgi:hypothetical protein